MKEVAMIVNISEAKAHFSQIIEAGFESLDFSGRDALRLGTLPFHPRDPFDRMLISQALERHLRVVTQDPHSSSTIAA